MMIELPALAPKASILTGSNHLGPWEKGEWPDYLTWDPECSMPVSTYPRCARVALADGTPFVEEPKPTCENPADTPIAVPFWVVASSACSTFGVQNIDGHKGRADRALAAKLPSRVALAAWSGDVNGGPQHARNDGVDIESISFANAAINLTGAGAATSIRAGVSALLRAAEIAGSYTPTIHMPGWMAPYVTDDGQSTRQGDSWFLYGEHPLILGPGYPGTGPTGTAAPAANQAWIYATGPIYTSVSEWTHHTGVGSDGQAYGPDDFASAAQNVVEVRAEKLAVVAFDPCAVFAVLVQW